MSEHHSAGVAESGAKADNIRLPVYLDNQATTPMDPRVLDAMMPYFTEKFGNPHSRTHAYGWEAEEAVERARRQVAGLIGADDKEIVFTSGATESNNLAIKGAAGFYGKRGKRHVITSAIEHKCVLECCERLREDGFEVTVLGVDSGGLIDLDALAEAIRDDTLLVSIMAVNNEIGVVQPIEEIGRLCRERGVLFHTDAAQATGKIALDVGRQNIDLLSISGHKMYGPKGVGALYVRRRPRVRLKPLMDGGGQERGMRSGTLATPLVVGLGEAAAIARREMDEEVARVAGLRDRLLAGLRARLDGVHLNGDGERRVAGNLSISFDGLDANALITASRDLAMSSGSACSSAAVEPSYVLRAIGIDQARADATVRIGLGRFTTSAEVDYAVAALAAHVEEVRARVAADG